MKAPKPRAAALAALFARAAAAGKPAWGIDARGKGGRFGPRDRHTDGWRVPVDELRWVCVEGERQWTRLPEG